jgi:hypothetical protein
MLQFLFPINLVNQSVLLNLKYERLKLKNFNYIVLDLHK